MRIIAGLMGVAIALVLRINTFEILASLFPESVRPMFTGPSGYFGGIIVTGLASSAGSGFWHDQMGRLRAIKDATRDAG